MSLCHLANNTSAHMLRVQKKYQKCFKKRVRPSEGRLQIGFFVLTRPERAQRGKATQKLALIANRPYEVAFMDDTTVTVKIVFNIRRISRYSVVPSSGSSTKHST